MKFPSRLYNISDVSEVENKSSEDNMSNVNTEDSLLSSKSSSQTMTKPDAISCYKKEDLRSKCQGSNCKIICGVFLLLWGICSVIWLPFDIFMDERLKMRPLLPPYEWWKSPPDEVLLRVYVFNITNAENFLNGRDAKLNLQEIGPIIFLEKLTHTNVKFNDNDTLTYMATRTPIFLPEMNTIDLNQTITVANVAVLGMASYFWDSPFFEKWAFNMLVRSSQSNVTVNTTIYNYLWNFTDPVMIKAKTIAPKMVPVSNLGILSRIYDDFQDNVTVYIGEKNGHEKFFQIDRYDGSEYLPGHGSTCDDTVLNSTEGVAYPQFLTKNSTLRYWRKTLCLVTKLLYDSERYMYGVNVYKFSLVNSTYDRTKPTYNDCYRSDPALPDGISDVSKCYYNLPLGSSFPHFLYGDPKIRKYVTGLQPNVSKHESFVYVEPLTGLPTQSIARSQSNLVLRTLEGFRDDIERFSDLVVPMFWAEYNQVGIPWYIVSLMYFTVKILPIFQRIFTLVLFCASFVFLFIGMKQLKIPKQTYLLRNKLIRYEQETFLKA